MVHDREGLTAEADLTCPTMRLLVLAHLLELQDSKPSTGPLGVSVMRRLHQYSASDLVRLAKVSRTGSIQIKVNTTKLAFDMNRYEHMRSDSEAFNYFVQHGAPTALIMSLFSRAAADVKRAQQMMGIEPPTGRPTMPPDDIRLEIWARWEQLRSGMSGTEMMREHYIALHKEFSNYSIAQLSGVIKTFMSEVRFRSPEVRKTFSAY